MFKSKESENVSTIVGQDAEIEGRISFKGAIRLDGIVKGKVESEGGTVIIGENAEILGDIAVATAIIMGRVTGTVTATSGIDVRKPGRIEGDMLAPKISIETGVVFNGNCVMGEPGNLKDNGLKIHDKMAVSPLKSTKKVLKSL